MDEFGLVWLIRVGMDEFGLVQLSSTNLLIMKSPFIITASVLIALTLIAALMFLLFLLPGWLVSLISIVHFAMLRMFLRLFLRKFLYFVKPSEFLRSTLRFLLFFL